MLDEDRVLILAFYHWGGRNGAERMANVEQRFGRSIRDSAWAAHHLYEQRHHPSIGKSQNHSLGAYMYRGSNSEIVFNSGPKGNEHHYDFTALHYNPKCLIYSCLDSFSFALGKLIHFLAPAFDAPKIVCLDLMRFRKRNT